MNILLLILPYLQKGGAALLRHWREAIVLSMTFFIWYQNFSETRFVFAINTIPYMEKQLAETNSQLDTCKDGNKTLAASIDQRNAEVLKWKEVSDKLEKDNELLIAQIGTLHKQTIDRVRDILAGKTPKTCAESINYLRDELGEFKWPK